LNTGGVQIIQQNSPVGTKPIYENGNWSSSATTLGFTNIEKTQFHQQTIVAVQSAYNSVGGASKGAKLSQWASKNFTNGTPGQTSVTPQNPRASSGESGGGLGTLTATIFNPSETFKNISVNGGGFGLSNEKELFGSDLKYPIDMMTNQQDHFTITMYKYRPSSQEAIFGGIDEALKTLRSGLQRGSNLESIIGTVFLPMPNSVADSNNVSWGEDSMGNIAAAVTGATIGDVKGNATAAVAGAVVGGILGESMKGMAGKFLLGKNLLKAVSSGSISPELGALATSDLSSKLIKAQGFGVESESILARGAGIVPNSNLELLFNGPSLRSFSFTYRLSPRSSEEAQVVRRIIRFFKQGMAAKKLRGKSGESSYFLGTPNVFKLQYRNGSNPIDAVNKFKTCALTSFQCNYTPDGLWAAYESGQPVSTVFTMSFSELEPIFDTDYQENNIFENRDDLSSINSNSVGY